MSELAHRGEALASILDPATIRSRTRQVYDSALAGGTAFSVRLENLGACVDFVLEVTRRNYPDGRIPYHGRYEHFRAGGIDRVAEVRTLLAGSGLRDPVEQARSLIDLVLVSVLLDAGAGDAWCYRERGGGAYSRSEGLALASLDLFLAGAFSHEPSKPFQVTALGLERLTPSRLAQGFQVTDGNPLAGLEGRFGLLRRLSTAMRAYPDLFGRDEARPGRLLDSWAGQSSGKALQARSLLENLLIGLSRMWPARVTCEGVGFGDAWPYFGDQPSGWVPFHKLSQWLAYSLIEPIESAGIRVAGLGELTGLPEYRNGGLFLDFGVLRLRDPELAKRELEASSREIIEWRALTVQLLDQVGEAIREKLGKAPEELPLARVLQGGTWAAGREIARRLREGGAPPLKLKSDGMVF